MGARGRPEGDIRRAALKYVLLQLPDKVLLLVVLLALRSWLEWSWALIAGLVAIWVAIDMAIFPLVWRAYDPTARSSEHDVVALSGVAKERLAPEGYVLVRGELWRARADGGEAIEAGTAIRVVAAEGLTLRVRAEHEKEREAS